MRSRWSAAKWSCFGQPKPMKTIPAPLSLMRRTISSSSSAESLRKGGDSAPAMIKPVVAPREVRTQGVDHLPRAAVKVDRDPFHGGPVAQPQHQFGSADAVRQAGAVEAVERPANGLAVGGNHVELDSPCEAVRDRCWTSRWRGRRGRKPRPAARPGRRRRSRRRPRRKSSRYLNAEEIAPSAARCSPDVLGWRYRILAAVEADQARLQTRYTGEGPSSPRRLSGVRDSACGPTIFAPERRV